MRSGKLHLKVRGVGSKTFTCATMFLVIAAMVFSKVDACAQAVTIVNNSKTSVFFQLGGVDNNNSNRTFASVTTPVAASSKVVYQSISEINWLGSTSGSAIVFTSLNALFTDPSGACEVKASNLVGKSEFKFSNRATLKISECAGKGGDLTLVWTSKNGNVLVTIN